MKYLIKDLARITGLSPARIRKWQERFGLLKPEIGSNGYHYYSNADLLILQNVRRRVEAGEPLERVVALGHSALASAPAESHFTEAEWHLLNLVAAGRLERLGRDLVARKRGLTVRAWNVRVLAPLCELVGRGWQAGVLSVADEHAFSRWFFTFYMQRIPRLEPEALPLWLVVTHPQDEHELGALMHYGRLLEMGVAARFCGRLPEEDLFRELHGTAYKGLSISLVMPRNESLLLNLRLRLRSRFSDLRVIFGGWGWRNRIRAQGGAK